MNFPQPWIESTVLEKLEQFSNDCFWFSSSSSGFEVHMGKGKAVQVVAFYPSSSEFLTTTISDGTNSIQANIYSRKPGEPTRGSIINLRDFTLLTPFLTCDPTSKRGNRLVLEIHDFKVLGCENSAKFGRPINVLSIENIAATLDKLRAKAMTDPDIQSGQRSRPMSPYGSQLQPLSAGAFPPKEHATQVMFATQMVAPINGPPPMPTEWKKNGAAPSTKTNLLNLLMEIAPKKPETKPAIWQDESASRNKENKALKYPPVLSQIPADDILRSSSRLDSMANIRQNRSSQLSHSSNEEKSLSIPADDTPISTQPKLLSDDSEKENSQGSKNQLRTSGDGAKENSQGNAGQEKAPEAVPAAENEMPAVEMVKLARQVMTLPFEDPFNTGGNPFAGKQRVPRSYVTIPQDQQELLDRDDAWYSPSTGSTKPYATMPIKVREDLVAFATSSIKKDVEVPNLDLNLGSDEEESGTDSDGGSHVTLRSIEEDNEGKASPLTGLSGFKNHKSNDAFERVDSDVADDWTPSPEAHKHHTLATLGIPPPTFESSNATDVEQNTTHIEKTIQIDLPALRTTDTLPPPPYASRVQVFDFPSSSGLESDLEVVELHAEGEKLVGNEGGIIQVPDTSQEVPSTAAQRASLIRAEQSPFFNGIVRANGLFRSAGLEGALPGNDKEGGVSSDAIIPATFKELSQQSKLSKLSLAENMDEASHADQGGVNIECSTPGGEDKNEGGLATQAETFSYLFDEQSAFERGNSQVTEANIPSSPPPIPAEFSFTRNRSDQPFDSPSHRHSRSSISIHCSSPRGPSALAVDTLTAPAISGRPTEVPSSPQLPTPFVQRLSLANSSTASTPASTPKKRPRRRSIATAIMKEEFTRKDVYEMVRATRHEFNENCSGSDLLSKPLPSQSLPHPIVQPSRPSPPVEQPSTPIRYLPTQQEPSSPIHPKSIERATEAQELVPEETHSQKSGTSRSSPHRQVDTYLGSASRVESTQSKSLPLERSQTNSPRDADFYHQFRTAYPDYRGSRNNFTWALVYIEWLRKARQLLHRSLCDDFIRVISFDYINYVRGCQGKAKTGWQYYDENVLKQEYSSQIVTPENLQPALLTLDPGRIQKIRSAFEQPYECTPSQSQGSKMITHTQTQAMSGPPSQNHAIKSTPSAPSPAPHSSTAKTRRILPWPSPVKDSTTLSLKTKTEQRKAPVEPPLPIQKMLSQVPPIPRPNSPERTRSVPASPEYVNFVEEQATPECISTRAASPILGSKTPPSISDNNWRKAIENVKRRKEGQARRHSSSPFQAQPASSKRKSIFQPEDMLQASKRHRIASQTSQTATPFQPPKPSFPTSSCRSVKAPNPTFQTPSLSTLKSFSTSTATLADGINRVNGWLDRKPNPKRSLASFEEFVKKRREGGKFSSRAGTPADSIVGGKRPFAKPGEVLAGGSRDGTSMGGMRGNESSASMLGDGKSLCTKPKVRGVEPKTQPWGYEP